MKPASLLVVIILWLVALAHLLRLVFSVEVLVGGFAVPMWPSVVALVVAGALAVALWREAQPGAT